MASVVTTGVTGGAGGSGSVRGGEDCGVLASGDGTGDDCGDGDGGGVGDSFGGGGGGEAPPGVIVAMTAVEEVVASVVEEEMVEVAMGERSDDSFGAVISRGGDDAHIMALLEA